MNKQNQVYESKLTKRIKNELIGSDGEIRRVLLERGLGLAYAGNLHGGKLTLSRPAEEEPPSKREIEIVKRDFTVAAGLLGLKVLKVRKTSQEKIRSDKGSYHVVRLLVSYGEQMSLL